MNNASIGTGHAAPTGRIVGVPNPERRLLLTMVDHIVDEVTAVWRIAEDGWRIDAVLVARPDGSELVVLRGLPTLGPLERKPFAWGITDQIARRISRELWQVTAVVPDVATPPPSLDDAPFMTVIDEDELLSA